MWADSVSEFEGLAPVLAQAGTAVIVMVCGAVVASILIAIIIHKG